jgi:hypothetical protein
VPPQHTVQHEQYAGSEFDHLSHLTFVVAAQQPAPASHQSHQSRQPVIAHQFDKIGIYQGAFGLRRGPTRQLCSASPYDAAELPQAQQTRQAPFPVRTADPCLGRVGEARPSRAPT